MKIKENKYGITLNKRILAIVQDQTICKIMFVKMYYKIKGGRKIYSMFVDKIFLNGNQEFIFNT